MKEIKEHEISNILHRGLSVVPKTDGEIYVSISIGEYIITFTCFLYCAKVVLLEVLKVRLPLQKSLSKKHAKLVENARINFQSGLTVPCCFLEKKTPNFLK